MHNTIQRVIDLAVEIQQIPAPTFHEQKRAEFVHGLFEKEGLEKISIDEMGNVYGLWRMGNGGGTDVKPLVVSAHLDTVFPLDMDLEVKREGDRVYGIGVGDNSMGVAALLGLIWMLREHQPSLGGSGGPAGDIWFVANVGEEGLGNLRGMKAVADRFGSDVRAYLVVEGLALGHIYHRAVGVRRYRIKAKTRGGHSWSDYGEPSAVLELSKLVVQFSTLKLPSHPRTTMNVGKIQGGTSINVIPSEASLELDLRSEGADELMELVAGVERLIEAGSKPGVSMEADVIGERPAGEVSPDHPLVRLAEECLIEQGLEPRLTSGSTDANIPLSRGYPALVLGVTKGGGAHTKDEYVEVPPVETGMEQLVRFVEKAWG